MQKMLQLFLAAFLMTAILLSLAACGKEKATGDFATVAVSDRSRRDRLTVGCLISEEYFYFKGELFYAAAEMEDMSAIG